jgi:hypothetical protein
MAGVVGGTNQDYEKAPKKKRAAADRPGKRWMEDGDDAHFSDNPAVRKPKGKRSSKKRGGRKSSKR